MSKLFSKKKDCCGCEACANVCPKNIIKMYNDSEGFYYPKMINPEKCINCNLCQEVCPNKNIKIRNDFEENRFIGYSKNECIIRKSSSGGFATELGKAFIRHGGVVFGVRYSNNYMDVLYTLAKEENDLQYFQSSKYVQARKKDIYIRIREELHCGNKVLFIGLPCEVNACRLIFKNEKLLYTCSLICHGPTSIEVHKQYCKINNINNEKIKDFTVRYKKDSWKPYYIRIIYESGNTIIEEFQKSMYGFAFRFMKRPSCNKCKIKRFVILSNITIGDYHTGDKYKGPICNPLGLSNILVHDEKGKELLEMVNDFDMIDISGSDPTKNVAYARAIPAYYNRKQFGKVFSTRGLQEACNLHSCYNINLYIKYKELLIKRLSFIKQWLIKLLK